MSAEAYRAAVSAHGRETFAFSGLKPGLAHWQDGPPPEGTGAALAYVDTGRTWVAIGAPVGPEHEVERAAERFVAAAKHARKNACFFATERHLLETMRIGEQPIFSPRAWPDTLKASRSLREQLRRARKKGVRVRAVEPAELAPGSPLREVIDQMARRWLDAHHLEPMRFIVGIDSFYHPESHKYFVAERDGRAVAFLSAVPIPARDGWLVEDVYRAPDAPNGTSECLLDALFRAVPDAALVTLGLAPLSGDVPLPLRLARRALRPLYDFAGLAAYKRRLSPMRWEPVWLAHPPRRGLWSLFASLRAFAGGSLVAFAARSIVRHPSGPPFVLALPLLPWTLLLALLALVGQHALLGFSPAELWLWVAFDTALAVALYRAARRPRTRRLLTAAALGALDAALSLTHLRAVGFGQGSLEIALRAVATLAPVLGTLALIWAVVLSQRRSRT